VWVYFARVGPITYILCFELGLLRHAIAARVRNAMTGPGREATLRMLQATLRAMANRKTPEKFRRALEAKRKRLQARFDSFPSLPLPRRGIRRG